VDFFETGRRQVLAARKPGFRPSDSSGQLQRVTDKRNQAAARSALHLGALVADALPANYRLDTTHPRFGRKR
jgi:hypothetical protein